MGKPERQGRLRNAAEYAAFLLGYALLAWPPFRVSKIISMAMADTWRFFDRKHRRRAFDQITDRLGLNSPQARRLVRDNYRHYALFALEACRLKRMPPEEAVRRVDANGCDALMRNALAAGKGMVIASGHLGNWEWGAVFLGKLGVCDGMIARRLKNPRIDGWIRSIRESTGMKVWEKDGGLRSVLAALRKSAGVITVMDQNERRNGCPAPFLGKECSTMSAPVDVAVRMGAPIVVAALMRNRDAEGLRFTMVPKRVHWPVKGADPTAERLRLATAVNDDLSAIIRDYPEQWIWTHDRWKERKTGNTPRPASRRSPPD